MTWKASGLAQYRETISNYIWPQINISMYNLDRIEKYIKDFFSIRYEHIDWFYRSTHQQRTYGVYKLKHGTKIMDLVISIHGNVEENLIADKLVPEKFATPDKLFAFLKSFKDFLNTNQLLLDANNEGEDTDMAITLLKEIKDDLVAMIDYVS
ncbi:hypothetical protein [Mucilaginibacter sp. SJ]|uniref:hypothetical protein n=1 Tax=Mucilaginibacter sp. SJ TaxID=3029053 RepID=UPI0023A9EF91|nr:hypothetical protein [Mucilaginibacter sp. SJ]WEA01839.1 hypothetical protein MusilaSJ_02735 [Mucilaginibacter sp. SJ]